MCNPVALVAASTAMQMVGSYQQGQAQSASYDYSAKVKEASAAQALKNGDMESRFTQDKAASDTKQLQDVTRTITGTQRAAAGANVGPGSLTTEDIAIDTTNKSKMDELMIRHNADMASWRAKEAAKQKAWELQAEAAGLRAAAKNASKGGLFGAGSSLLQGAGQIAWMKK